MKAPGRVRGRGHGERSRAVGLVGHVEVDRRSAGADGQGAVDEGEGVVGCSQGACRRGDRISPGVDRSRRRGGQAGGAGHHARGVAVDEAGDGRGVGSDGAAVGDGLVRRRDRQHRLGHAEGGGLGGSGVVAVSGFGRLQHTVPVPVR